MMIRAADTGPSPCGGRAASSPPAARPAIFPASALIFFLAAFPFLLPLVPSTDTQPTFTLAAFLLAALVSAASFERPVKFARSDFLLGATILLGGIAWLTLSVAANGFEPGNINRTVSYAMLLVAITTGLLNPRIFTAGRTSVALKLYMLFTAVFVVSGGAIESVLIRSRDADAFAALTQLGRGASTLSPEPSFFAFQVFTLFLTARVTVWNDFTRRQRHLVQLMTLALLLASLGGYGVIYAIVVAFLAGWRYVLAGVALAFAAAMFLIGMFDIESLRFVRLFTTLLSDVASDDGTNLVTDLSTLGRLNSFLDYGRVFLDRPVFGDAFHLFGGGGLVSIPAAVGLFGAALLLLFLAAIAISRVELKLKLAMLVWLALQFVSGPVGLPLVGLFIGTVIATSRIAHLPGGVRSAAMRTPRTREQEGIHD